MSSKRELLLQKLKEYKAENTLKNYDAIHICIGKLENDWYTLGHALGSGLCKAIWDGDQYDDPSFFNFLLSDDILPHYPDMIQNYSADGREFTPLADAVNYTNNLEYAKALLKKGANPNAVVEYEGRTLLMQLNFTLRHPKEKLNLFLQHNADPNIQIDCESSLYDGYTALHFFVTNTDENNRIDCIKLLLDAGARKDIKDKRGKTPYDLYKSEDRLSDNEEDEISRLLKPNPELDAVVEIEEDTHEDDRLTLRPLDESSENDAENNGIASENQHILAKLEEYNVDDIDDDLLKLVFLRKIKDLKGNEDPIISLKTLLETALSADDKKLFGFLLSEKTGLATSYPSILNPESAFHPPLERAANKKSTWAIQLLLEAGAKKDNKNSLGQTAYDAYRNKFELEDDKEDEISALLKPTLGLDAVSDETDETTSEENTENDASTSSSENIFRKLKESFIQNLVSNSDGVLMSAIQQVLKNLTDNAENELEVMTNLLEIIIKTEDSHGDKKLNKVLFEDFLSKESGIVTECPSIVNPHNATCPLLEIAALEKSTWAIQLLLEAGAKKDNKNKYGKTAYEAYRTEFELEDDKEDEISTLLKPTLGLDAVVDETDESSSEHEKTVNQRLIEILQKLTDNENDLKSTIQALKENKDPTGALCLRLSACIGWNDELFNALLSIKDELLPLCPNFLNPKLPAPPLHEAAYCKNKGAIKALLAAGADKNHKNSSGQTAYTIYKKRVNLSDEYEDEISRLLKPNPLPECEPSDESKPTESTQDNETKRAAKNLIKELEQYRKDNPEARSNSSLEIPILSCGFFINDSYKRSFASIVETLIRKSIIYKDKKLFNFLLLNENIAPFLNEALNPNIPSSFDPPLHYAATNELTWAIEQLLNAGAQKELKNKHGLTAYQHYRRHAFLTDECEDEISRLLKPDLQLQQDDEEKTSRDNQPDLDPGRPISPTTLKKVLFNIFNTNYLLTETLYNQEINSDNVTEKLKVNEVSRQILQDVQKHWTAYPNKAIKNEAIIPAMAEFMESLDEVSFEVKLDTTTLSDDAKTALENLFVYCGKLQSQPNDGRDDSKLNMKMSALKGFLRTVLSQETLTKDSLADAYEAFESADKNQGSGFYLFYSLFTNKRYNDAKGRNHLIKSTTGELVDIFYQQLEKETEIKQDVIDQRRNEEEVGYY